jgi:predicted amidophosphoribosyltransferase
MKYRPSVSLAQLGGYLLRDAIPSVFVEPGWDMILPIPSSPALFRRRFFHPCLELAIPTSRKYNIPIRALLAHHTKRAPQASLSHKARLANLRKIFRVKTPNALKDKRILIIEDVITTGATTAAAAYQLRLCGAARIDVIALARTHVWTRFRARLSRLLE